MHATNGPGVPARGVKLARNISVNSKHIDGVMEGAFLLGTLALFGALGAAVGTYFIRSTWVLSIDEAVGIASALFATFSFGAALAIYLVQRRSEAERLAKSGASAER